jgi:hypothetical protein
VNPALSLGGYAATFGSTATAKTRDDQEVAYRFAASAFDGWLRGVHFDARTVPVKWAHGADDLTGQFGYVASASIDEIGVRVVCELENSPASRLLLDAADNGRLGFSCHGRPARDVDSGEIVDGKPLYIIEASTIEEVSLCLRERCADPASTIDMVGGVPASYLHIGAAQDRDHQLGGTYGFKQTVGLLSDLRTWGGFSR